MTKQNAENSNQAEIPVSEAEAPASEANEAMARMAEAIRQIRSSSDNTAKISKAIDEIAFQTNLLALSAAVKVTQAGDAGNGFEVVSKALVKALENSIKVSGLISDISASCIEQINGIEQINKAVAQMNAVTRGS